MATGIRDKVAIIGMGCSRFGERWDCGADDLMLEAFAEAVADAGVERDRIEAAWLGVFYQEQSTSKSGLPLSMVRLDGDTTSIASRTKWGSSLLPPSGAASRSTTTTSGSK